MKCPHCDGRGTVEPNESDIRRRIEQIVKDAPLPMDELVKLLRKEQISERDARKQIEVLLFRGSLFLNDRLQLQRETWS